MNIQQAKQQIRNAVSAYLAKDEFGEYEIPVEEQRPVLLLGAPGIGKTAIMKQISQELGIGLVSYSMTHHTRQSALGLPYITEKDYGGVRYMVSEYTMSEIIASVYNLIEDTGIHEGILFLDEINCVSETLMPSMLQFLQFKTFGGHRVPDGWIIVTAGNPPEYNRSVHQLDIVTMDRVKRIDVEPDYSVWKEYALSRNIHPAILSYLELRKDHFYAVESSTSGKLFVTARGWMDLSAMLRLYEKQDLVPDGDLVSQYLQHGKIAREFSNYYALFRKYQADYQIGEILDGRSSAEIRSRAASAPFDERLALVSLLIDAVTGLCENLIGQEEFCLHLAGEIKKAKENDGGEPGDSDIRDFLELTAARAEEMLSKGKRSGLLTAGQRSLYHRLREFCLNAELDSREALMCAYRAEVSRLREDAASTGTRLENLFRFFEEVWPKGQETLILVTELTMNPHTSAFISHYGCPGYFRHSQDLLFYERNKEIIRELQELQ